MLRCFQSDVLVYMWRYVTMQCCRRNIICCRWWRVVMATIAIMTIFHAGVLSRRRVYLVTFCHDAVLSTVVYTKCCGNLLSLVTQLHGDVLSWSQLSWWQFVMLACCNIDVLSRWRVYIWRCFIYDAPCCRGTCYCGDLLSLVTSCHVTVTYTYNLHGDVLGFHGNNCYDEHL